MLQYGRDKIRLIYWKYRPFRGMYTITGLENNSQGLFPPFTRGTREKKDYDAGVYGCIGIYWN
jgi:hypothetical protein